MMKLCWRLHYKKWCGAVGGGVVTQGWRNDNVMSEMKRCSCCGFLVMVK